MERRADFDVIAGFVRPGSRVLDLGCGGGELLVKLREEKDVDGEGIELSEAGVEECIRNGVAVHHGDIDEGLDSYADDTFDYVILSQTLQVTHKPLFVLSEMLRVGSEAIVSIPNFGHWAMRWQLLHGRMPVTETFPYEWYDTPNIRHATIRDFEEFCAKNSFAIRRRAYLVDTRRARRWGLFKNLFSEVAVYVITGGDK